MYDGEIYLNKKGYFYDARDKKHKFTKDEIDRIWLGLMEKRYVLEETIRVRTKRNTNLATPQKAPIQKSIEAEIIEENPNQGVFNFWDDSPNVIEYTKEEAEELGAFEETALSEEDAIEASKPSSSNGFIKGIFKRIVGK